MHERAHTPSSPNKHTPPRADFSSSCSFLLGTLKPVHVSQCPSLSRLCPLHQPPPPPLFHFTCSLPPFHNPLNTSKPSFQSHLSNISSCHSQQSEICRSLFLSAPFSSSSSCCVTVAAFFLTPTCNSAVTPDAFFKTRCLFQGATLRRAKSSADVGTII